MKQKETMNLRDQAEGWFEGESGGRNDVIIF